MSNYLVTWVIDIEDVETPVEAAEQAFGIMQRLGSTANVFQVKLAGSSEEVEVDLQREFDMGNIGIPAGVTPTRCPHGVNVWRGHECGDC